MECNTRVYKDLNEFKKRKNQTLNGVDKLFVESFAEIDGISFVEEYLKISEENKTNQGCWNCLDSTNCIDCNNLIGCDNLTSKSYLIDFSNLNKYE